MDQFEKLHDRKLLLKKAKDECSKDKRCVGIEAKDSRRWFTLCLYAIYVSTGVDKYEDFGNILYTKKERRGKYMSQFARCTALLHQYNINEYE